MVHHQGQVERIDFIGGQRQADQPPAVGGHEIDVRGCDFFGGHAEIALIFTIFVVHEDDHLALADIPNGFFYGEQWHRCF